MTLPAAPYVEQAARWPLKGKHILAHYDEDTIVVYQAYHASIGQYAIKNRAFGGDFSYSRMSWIKPNFLWMMFRSGWGTKEGQEIILGLRLRVVSFSTSYLFGPLLQVGIQPIRLTRTNGNPPSPVPTCVCSGIPIMTLTAKCFRGAPFNWGLGALHSMRSVGVSCSRSST